MPRARTCCLALVMAALSGCGSLSTSLEGPADIQAYVDNDLAYLNSLNARVDERLLSEEDKELLWRAYVARLQGTAEAARARILENTGWRYTFVAPMF